LKDSEIAEKLCKEGALSEASCQKIGSAYSSPLFSIGIELRSVLYIGILLLSSGLGVLVYKNIDSIGHIAVLSFIALVSAGCFAYSYSKRLPYTNQKIVSPNTLADYILLLGCLTFATFMGYLQYQYSAFGPHNEIAFLIPAIIFFAVAYYFDHLGVLSMAITALAGFIGITITPLQLLSSNDFSSGRIIFSGIGLGAALVGTAFYLNKRKIKSHFTFTYLSFSMHLLFISILAGLFIDDIWLIFILPLALFSFLVVKYAYAEESFYFLLFAVLYTYIGVSTVFFKLMLLMDHQGDSLILLVPMYFIATSVYMIVFLRKANKQFKPHDNI
jgi:hypothetical protein